MSGPHDRQPSGSPPTILLVDNDSVSAKRCKTVLQEDGFRVFDAEGSSDALKICTQYEGAIDLLLTDLVLPPPGFQLASSSNQFPHVHGHELAIRAARIQKGLRVILMSDNPEKELAAHGIKRETLPILTKPFGNGDVLELIRNVLGQPAPTFEVSEQGKASKDTEWFG